MVKTKILRKQKGLSENTQIVKIKKGMGIDEYSPTEVLQDEKFISMVIWNCLKNNEPEGVIEAIQAHLEAVNKVQLAKDAQISRSTLYNSLRGKNPTIKTLAKLIHSSRFC